MLQLNIFLYDIDFVDGELIGELCRRSIQKHEKSVKLSRYNNHIGYVNNINALFKAFRCTTCDTFFSKTENLERHFVTCSERVKHFDPKNVYELRETLFEKLDAFNIPYRNKQKLLKNMAIFDFESLCVKEASSYKQTETTTWIGKHVPVSVSISSNLLLEPIFLCNANPHHLISSFYTALEGIATQSKSQMKLNFIEVETAIKIKLSAILEQLNQWRNRADRVSNFVNDCIVEEKEKNYLHNSCKCKRIKQLTYRNILSATVTFYQSLDSTEQNTILIGPSRICYQFLYISGILNLQLWRNLISLFLWSLETFNYMTLWISSVVPPVFTFSSKLTRPKRQKVSFPTNGSIVQKKWTTKNFHPMTHSSAFCAITTRLKKITTTFKTLLLVV